MVCSSETPSEKETPRRKNMIIPSFLSGLFYYRRNTDQLTTFYPIKLQLNTVK